jgi:hypothetical protein
VNSPLRAPLLVLLAAALLAVAALGLAAASGPPYLDSGGVNGWIVVFAGALFAALLAVPFAIERRLRASHTKDDARWDRAVPLWGAVALAVLVAGALVGAGGGFAGDSLAGSAGLVMAIEAGLVVVALGAVLLSG